MPPDHKLFVAVNEERALKKEVCCCYLILILIEKREQLKTMNIVEKTDVHKKRTLRELVGKEDKVFFFFFFLLL
jgi:hypothetical protein